MRWVCTAAEVRELDRVAIEQLHVPGVALMESAAHAVAEALRRRYTGGRVVVACGAGNNGGDGYAAARWLHGWGVPVALWPLKDDLSGDALVQRRACETLGLPTVSGPDGAAWVVDALFGTGLARPLEGRYRQAVEAIASSGAKVLAVDLPSGLHADTGAVLGVAVQATHTVTFACLKRGLLCGQGPDLAGTIEVADIGLGISGGSPGAELPEPADLRWPTRHRADHKTRSGHLAVVAGSENMAGAAVLLCKGAVAGGAGLVTLLATPDLVPRLGALPPEVMVQVGSWPDALAADSLARFTAVAAGPGLGGGGPLSSALATPLEALWRASALPLVYDADALACTGPVPEAPRVRTPHPGEAGRLLGLDAAQVNADRFASAAQLADQGGVALLKGPFTLVAQSGTPTSVNPTNSAVLGSGGSGDVLTGVIGALLARGCSGRDAAILGAWVHGRAGERLQARRATGWSAADIAAEVPWAVQELLSGEPR